MDPRTKILKTMMESEGSFLLPGCHDALSARLAEQAGFTAIYMSGSAVTADLLGRPDLGLITQTEMVEQARRICDAVTIPLVCDIDTGYGNALNVQRTIQQFERAGVSGAQLEDQTFPKRCGHFDRKQVIATDEMIAKLHAALDARADPDFLIIARTDARAMLGLEEAIERGIRYGEAGADVVFVEAPQSTSEMQQLCDRVPYPMLVNAVEGGRTPQLTFEQYAEVGYKIILYPTAAIRAVMKSLQSLYSRLREERTTANLLDSLVSFKERNEITDLQFFEDLEDMYKTAGPDRTQPSGKTG